MYTTRLLKEEYTLWIADPGIRVALLAYTRGGEKLVAAAARASLSRKGFDKIEDMGAGEIEEWIRETLRRGHFSPWEHSTYTWLAEGCSRVCSHQLVRHRIASYTQQSMRYSEAYLRDAALQAARLLGIECPEKPGKSGVERRSAYECYSKALSDAVEVLDPGELYSVAWNAYVIPWSLSKSLDEAYEAAKLMVEATSKYYRLLSMGSRREDARFVVPHSVRTRIVVSMNARELVQSFFPLRLCMRAQWEIRRVAWALRSLLIRVHPLLFQYAGPRCLVAVQQCRWAPYRLEDLLEGEAPERCPEGVPGRAVPACVLSSMRDYEESLKPS